MTPAYEPDSRADEANAPTTAADRTTVNISGDLLAVIRGAIRLVRTKTGRDYSLRQFTDEAFAAQIRVIADTYNDGKAIKADKTPLEKGARGG